MKGNPVKKIKIKLFADDEELECVSCDASHFVKRYHSPYELVDAMVKRIINRVSIDTFDPQI